MKEILGHWVYFGGTMFKLTFLHLNYDFMGPGFHLFRSVNILQAMNANYLQHKSDT
jgi:hypothetical protein